MKPMLPLLALLFPASAIAAGCPLPAGFEGWREGGEATGAVRPGVAMRLALKPSGGFPWSAPLTHAAADGSFGTEAQVEVPRAGLYRLALDQTGWIDLLRAGRAVASADHRRGDPCTGIAKIVGFRLEAGRYTLQLSGSPTATMRVMLVRAE